MLPSGGDTMVVVIGQTIMQLKIGVELNPGQLVGMVGTWVIMGGIAVWLAFAFLRNLPNAEISEDRYS